MSFYYEDLRDYFLKHRDSRSRFRASLLGIAIEKSARGYKPVRDPKVSNFWKRYWRFCLKVAPQLSMPEPTSSIPKGSSFFYFRPIDIPDGVRLVHKAAHGCVDLQFEGWGKRIREFRHRLPLELPSGARIVSAAKSAAVRIRTPIIHVQKAFNSQRENVALALMAATALHKWASEHLEDWKGAPGA